MTNQTKINTKNHPEFLELGTKHNDQIVLMKQLERMETGMDDIVKYFLLTQGSIIILILVMIIMKVFNN